LLALEVGLVDALFEFLVVCFGFVVGGRALPRLKPLLKSRHELRPMPHLLRRLHLILLLQVRMRLLTNHLLLLLIMTRVQLMRLILRSLNSGGRHGEGPISYWGDVAGVLGLAVGDARLDEGGLLGVEGLAVGDFVGLEHEVVVFEGAVLVV